MFDALEGPTSGGSTGRPKIILATVPSEFDTDAAGFQSAARSACVIRRAATTTPRSRSRRWRSCPGNHVVNFPRFVPELVLAAVTEHQPEYLYLVPTMMARIWKLPERCEPAPTCRRWQIAVHMAAPCPPWLKEAWIDWVGPDVLCELYAGTEVQAITWITGREWLEHHGSVGRPIVGQMKVVDDHGEDLPAGEIGEIYMLADGGQGSTYRYLGADPKQLEDTEWESLGDMGWMDEDGYVYLADRRKDLILRGGANIYPAEVEHALDEHPPCAVAP